jgi:hypothetical protein
MEQRALKKCKQLFVYQHLLLLRDISGLYYKTFRIVIYDRKLRSSLERRL